MNRSKPFVRTSLVAPRALALALVAAFPAGGCNSEGLLGPPPAVQPTEIGRTGDGSLGDQLELIRGTHRLPALAGAIFGPDSILEFGVIGLQSLQRTDPMQGDDQWHIGSLTKSMTATVAATLVDQGVLSWDRTLAESFPALDMQPAYRSVRLIDLLTNTGGITSDATAAPSWSSHQQRMLPLAEQRAQLTKEYLAMSPASAVGTYQYSNAGYIVAGAVMEAMTGQSWEDLITAHLFQPLGMASVGFGPPTAGTFGVPWGHAILDDGFEPTPPGPAADNPPAMGPAGTVHATAVDLITYYQAHLNAAMGRASFVSQDSFDRLHAPAPGADYGCGWAIVQREWAGGTALTHLGSNNLWYASVWLAPAKGFGVLVLTNAGGLRASQALDDATVMLITRFTGEAPR